MAILNVAMTAIKAISKMSAKKAVSGGAKKFITNKAKEKVKGKVKDKFLGKKDKKEKGGALAVRPSSAIMVSGSTPLLPSTSASNSFDTDSNKSSSIIKKPTEKVNFQKLTESINNIVRITEDLNDASKKQLENDKDILEDERKRRQEAARKRRESLLESGKKVAGGAVKGATAVGEKFDLMKFFENILLGGAFLAIMNLLSGNQKTLDNLSQNIFRIYKVLPKLLKFLFDPLGLFEAVFKGIKKLLSPLTNTIKKAASNLTTKVKEVVERGFKNLGTAITEFVDDLGKKLTNAFTEALEQAAKQADEIIQAALKEATKQADVIVKAAKEQAERLIKEASEEALERGIKPAVKAVQQNVLDPAVDAAKKGGKAAFKGLPEGLQKGLTNVGQGARNIVQSGVGLARSGFNALTDVSKKIGKGLFELSGNAIKGARAAGENLAKKAANLKDTGEKALKEFAEKNLKPVMTKLMDENPLINTAKKFFTNPKTIKATVKTVDDQAKGVLGILKNARKSGLTQLGPLDRVIAVIESVVRYGLGEAPVNAVLQTLGGVLGYAAGFAVGAPFGGVPGLLTGLVGSELGERAAKLLIKSLLPLGKNEDGSPKLDQIAQTLGYPERPIIRDPYMEFEDYRNQFGIEGGKFFNADIPNLLGDKEESPKYFKSSVGYFSNDEERRFLGKTEEEAKAKLGVKTKAQTQPQERMMGGSASNKSSYGTAEQRKMLDAIAFAEGTTKSYGTLYGGRVIPELAKGQMTIAEVLQMQKTKKYKGENVYGTGYDSNATGRYQFMSYVLEEEIKRQGISSSEFFTPEMQDKLILNRISRLRGVTAKLLAEEGMSDKVIDMLAPEFASFPNLFGPDAQGKYGTNTSYYGQGGKTKEEIKRAYGQSSGMTESQSSTPATMDSSGSEQSDVSPPEPGNGRSTEKSESESAPQSDATSANISPTSSPSTAPSLQKRASYEQGADQDLVIPLPQQQNGGGGMIRSKSRVMMMGGDSLDRYYKAQLLGALYKRG